jgi:ATP adenylyltransferase
MEHLYAPWRAVYLMEVSMPECLFCDVIKDSDDEKNLILERADNWFIMINKYPYTTGHIMVVCNRHVEGVGDLGEAESRELTRALARSERALRKAYAPQGINIGANVGRCAGAGVVGHLHFHLVPRWQGDTSFLSTVGNTRVVSEHLNDTYARIRTALEKP